MVLLKLSKLKGMSELKNCHKTDAVEVTIFWKRPAPADHKNKTALNLKPTAKLPTSKPATESGQKAAPKLTPTPAPMPTP